jgi:hypothetical protein
MNIFRINTTAYEEEDFFILTDLRSEDVESILSPIVKTERETEQYYDNDSLVRALRDAFPYKVIEQYSEFETITI